MISLLIGKFICQWYGNGDCSYLHCSYWLIQTFLEVEKLRWIVLHTDMDSVFANLPKTTFGLLFGPFTCTPETSALFLVPKIYYLIEKNRKLTSRVKGVFSTTTDISYLDLMFISLKGDRLLLRRKFVWNLSLLDKDLVLLFKRTLSTYIFLKVLKSSISEMFQVTLLQLLLSELMVLSLIIVKFLLNLRLF